ncbi:MAG: trypsin-like peptidase domain-containing protein [Planctomycetota bacterium]
MRFGRAFLFLLFPLFPLVSASAAEEIAPCDLPGRCTVAITVTSGGRPFYGTGSIISPLGYVLTSTTVVPPKSNVINIISPGHFDLKGTLLVADEKTELALVRVDPPKDKPFPAFIIRRSGSAELGEVVMTVSNSFQLARSDGELSVSVGLLSGRYKVPRKLAQQPVYLGEVIETTAATNPGSDGGPLLDGSGRLIGVLSLNVSDARWLGVAVPIDVMLPRIEKAIEADLAKREVRGRRLKIARSPGRPIYPRWEARAARFREAAKKVAASVVAIKVDRTKDDARFTRQPHIGRTGPAALLGEMLKRPKGATVTGVIVEPDGWIATSYFNIAGTLKAVAVVLADGRELKAEVVGWDQELDLALLKVKAVGLPAVSLEPAAEIGTYICVLGRSPEPKSLTLTPGIVSAVGRSEDSRLQFDARANVGNTGGPLIGLDGGCLGIVGGVTLNSPHGQNSGIAFAAWSAVLPEALAELKKGVKIRRRPRAMLGVVGAPGAVDLRGVLVARVIPSSPAAKAGIRRHDSILKIDGVELEGLAQLVNIIRDKKPGDKVKLMVRRRSRQMELEATLAETR